MRAIACILPLSICALASVFPSLSQAALQPAPADDVAEVTSEPPAPEGPAEDPAVEASDVLSTDEPAAADDATAPASTPSISEATWSALKGKSVVVHTAAGAREGELVGVDGPELVLVGTDGRPFTVAKAEATDVRVAKAVAREPELPTTPPPAADAAREPADPPPSDPKEAREQKRKERRENRKHALLGAYTAHGAAYAHWRGAGVNAGHAAYSMDWGVGVNPSPKFGMYLVGGGLLGARIDDKTIRANYGRLAFMFAFGGKWYFSTFGAGVAFNRLKLDTETQKDIGLALPFKLFGRIPLPKKLYIGIGLSYELGAVRGFRRFVNGIGGQIVFGRW